MNKIKINLITILILQLLCLHSIPVLAYDLDVSLDDEIRKNYNPSKLEQDMALPALPKILEQTPNLKEIPVNEYSSGAKINAAYVPPVKNEQKSFSKKTADGRYAVLKKGTKFEGILNTSVSDKSKKGTKVSFVLKYPVTTTYLTVPAGTIFKGEVARSHPAQFFGNGGLIYIKINSMILNGVSHPLNSRVIEANGRNIFFNNIKGKRRYAKSMLNYLKPGVRFYNTMFSASAGLLNDGAAAIWSPFPLALGVLGLGSNVLVAPALAVFSKGTNVSLSSGNYIEIKLQEDMIIYN